MLQFWNSVLIETNSLSMVDSGMDLEKGTDN